MDRLFFSLKVLIGVCHYVWAIPLKLAILLYLLYVQLGTGSVVASVLCLVLMVPLQVLETLQIQHSNPFTTKEKPN